VALEYAHAVRLALELHPPPCAPVAGEGGGHWRWGEAELDGRGERGGGVQRVVAARNVHGQLREDLAERAVVGGDREAHPQALGLDVTEPVVGAARFAVPADPLRVQAGRHGLRAWV